MPRFAACMIVALSLSTVSGDQQMQPGAPAGAVQLPDPTVVVVDTGPNATALYHRDSCSWLRAGTTTIRFVPAEAKKRYFQPHCLCIAGHEGVPPCETASSSSPVPTMSNAPAAALPAVTAAAPASKPAAPRAVPRSTRCQAMTKKGTQCSRNAQAGRAYCWQHGR